MDEPSAGSTTPEPEKEKPKPSRGRALVFDSPEPWPERIGTAGLLDLLVVTIHRHVVLDEHQAVAVALWTALTYVYDEFDVLPIRVAESPTRIPSPAITSVLPTDRLLITTALVDALIPPIPPFSMVWFPIRTALLAANMPPPEFSLAVLSFTVHRSKHRIP